jgi:hypothetical protein
MTVVNILIPFSRQRKGLREAVDGKTHVPMGENLLCSLRTEDIPADEKPQDLPGCSDPEPAKGLSSEGLLHR